MYGKYDGILSVVKVKFFASYTTSWNKIEKPQKKKHFSQIKFYLLKWTGAGYITDSLKLQGVLLQKLIVQHLFEKHTNIESQIDNVHILTRVLRHNIHCDMGFKAAIQITIELNATTQAIMIGGKL